MDGPTACIGLMIIVVPMLIWAILANAADREKREAVEQERFVKEQAEKQRKFLAWYNSLTTEEKTLYQLERQNKLLEEQGTQQANIAGMVATHNMFDTLHRH